MPVQVDITRTGNKVSVTPTGGSARLYTPTTELDYFFDTNGLNIKFGPNLQVQQSWPVADVTIAGVAPADATAAGVAMAQVFAAAVAPSRVILTADVANVAADVLADVTGLQFPVVAGLRYKFKATIVYTAAATTTGSRWAINGPAITDLAYGSAYPLDATSQTLNCGLGAYNLPAAANASSLAANNIATVEGVICCSASGNVVVRFASEVATSAITAKALRSFIEYEVL